MILDIYKPEQFFGTPTGGTTLIALAGTWTGYNASSVILDDDPLNLGNLEPQLSVYKATEQFGEITKSYTHTDREMTFKIQVTGNTFNDLKNAVQSLQTILSEATEYAINDGQTAFNPTSIGFPLMLKYQPDSTVAAHYFVIKGGGIDTSTFNDTIKMLIFKADIQVKIKTSYAAYGDAVYLNNVIPNGSAHHGFKNWTPSGGYAGFRTAGSITFKEWTAQAENAANAGSPTTMLPLSAAAGADALYGNVALPTDAATYFRWENSGAVNTGNEMADTFTRTDSASTMGSTEAPNALAYTAVAGTWGIRSNTGYSATDANLDRAIFTQANENIFSATVKNGFQDASNYRQMGLLHRYLDSSNYAYVFWDYAFGTLHLVTTIAGTPTNQTINSGIVAFQTYTTNNPFTAACTLKIVSVGKWSYYFLGNDFQGAFDFSAVATLNASGANKLGYILLKTGAPTSGFQAYVDTMVATNIVTLTSDWVNLSGVGLTGTGTKFWLDQEFRINGSGADSAFMTAKLEYFLSGTPGTVTQLGSTLNLGGSTSGGWSRVSWGSASSLNGISGVVSVRLKYTSSISKAGTATIDLRKGAVWAFPGNLPTAMVKIPTTEYVHQSYESRDSCIITGIGGNIETNVRLKINSPNIEANSAIYQQLDLGVRRQTALPGPIVLDYGGYTLTLNKAVNNNSNYANPGIGLANSVFATAYPYSDYRARTYKLILIASTNGICGMGFGYGLNFAGLAPTNQKPYFGCVPNAYLAELPNTAGVTTAIDCGLITMPPYNAGSTYATTPNWALTFFATANTSGSSFSNVIYQAVFLPADQFSFIDTREVSGDMAWASIAQGLVLDSLLRESTSSYYSHIETDQVLFFNPNAGKSPIRFYPATLSNPSPMIMAGTVRRVGTAGIPNTAISLTDALMYSILYCPAYAL